MVRCRSSRPSMPPRTRSSTAAPTSARLPTSSWRLRAEPGQRARQQGLPWLGAVRDWPPHHQGWRRVLQQRELPQQPAHQQRQLYVDQQRAVRGDRGAVRRRWLLEPGLQQRHGQRLERSGQCHHRCAEPQPVLLAIRLGSRPWCVRGVPSQSSGADVAAGLVGRPGGPRRTSPTATLPQVRRLHPRRPDGYAHGQHLIHKLHA